MKRGSAANIRFLLKVGARPDIKNKDGKSPIELDSEKTISAALAQEEAERKERASKLGSSNGKGNGESSPDLSDGSRGKWVSDHLVSVCKECEVPFSFFRRKHHCRFCGNIFCNECTTHKSEIEGYVGPQRVCGICAVALATKK
eukprot:TRINITY_DN2613_c0_g1_i1.p1 TRINITY_DN2613_c0_g1~~TRINITY_DN2613_c0_g1_i1.p1  ORF type:complete len:144 (+),score=24.44 TRINITY_DN2613_c0_g1_i1:541-972(+)